MLAIYNADFQARLNELLAELVLDMPPSSAVAGVYAATDRNRGVWKAPANVSLNGVTAPLVKITNAQQGEINVHATGKSINAIRAFAGRGGDEADLAIIDAPGAFELPSLAMAAALILRQRDFKRMQVFSAEASKRGAFFHPHHNWFLMSAHQKRDIQQSLDVADEAFGVVKKEFGS